MLERRCKKIKQTGHISTGPALYGVTINFEHVYIVLLKKKLFKKKMQPKCKRQSVFFQKGKCYYFVCVFSNTRQTRALTYTRHTRVRVPHVCRLKRAATLPQGGRQVGNSQRDPEAPGFTTFFYFCCLWCKADSRSFSPCSFKKKEREEKPMLYYQQWKEARKDGDVAL